MRLVLLGPPGVGKGTQGQRLASDRGWSLISTGDMLRLAVAEETGLGKQVKSLIEAGLLVPDEVMIQLVKARTAKPDATHGFILDGFPRTVPQADALQGILSERGQQLDAVLCLSAPDEEIVGRLAKRGRVDDVVNTVRKRLEVYRAQTAPLVEYYRGQGLLREVEGVGELETIHGRLIAALNGRPRSA